MHDSTGRNKLNKIIGYSAERLKIYAYEKRNIDSYKEYCAQTDVHFLH